MCTFFCCCWPLLLLIAVIAGIIAVTAANTGIVTAFNALVSVLVTPVVSLCCPCISAGTCGGIYWRCCKNKGNKTKKKAKARTANRNFGKGTKRDGILTLSPPGGKTRGKIPDKIGLSSSFKKSPTYNDSARAALQDHNTDDFDLNSMHESVKKAS